MLEMIVMPPHGHPTYMKVRHTNAFGVTVSGSVSDSDRLDVDDEAAGRLHSIANAFVLVPGACFLLGACGHSDASMMRGGGATILGTNGTTEPDFGGVAGADAPRFGGVLGPGTRAPNIIVTRAQSSSTTSPLLN